VWTNKVLEALDRYARNGLTTIEIAAELSKQFGNTYTRNMVVGKMHRIKVENGHVPKTRSPWSYNTRPNNTPIIHNSPLKFQPTWVCQYMDDNYVKCEKPSQGPWCPEHRKIVYADRSKTFKSNHQATKVARLFRI